MTAPTAPSPLFLPPEAIAEREADAVLDGALVTEAGVELLDITGPGAVSCVQGLLTADIEKPGEGAFVYGAVLTPKGMIICDVWAERHRGSVRFAVPHAGRSALDEVLRRSLPPRLARVADRSSEHAVLRLVGPLAIDLAGKAGLAVPPEGREATAILGEAACTVARPEAGGPFALQVVVPRALAPGVRQALTGAGAVAGDPPALELARLLAGWPALGAEIDEKTLPQEVRYDEIGGVSYTKGCYTGQETVARLHFRGHPNRHLRGLAWDTPPDPHNPAVVQDELPRGRVSTIAWVAPLERHLGLGLLRREVDLDRPLIAAGAEAQVVPLPFPVDS